MKSSISEETPKTAFNVKYIKCEKLRTEKKILMGKISDGKIWDKSFVRNYSVRYFSHLMYLDCTAWKSSLQNESKHTNHDFW